MNTMNIQMEIELMKGRIARLEEKIEQLTVADNTEPETAIDRLERRVMKAISRASEAARFFPDHSKMLNDGFLTKSALRRMIGTVNSGHLEQAIGSLIRKGKIIRINNFQYDGARSARGVEVLLRRPEPGNPVADHLLKLSEASHDD